MSDKTKQKKIKLSPIRESFCQHYTKHWNATRAAKEAGYKPKWAQNIGYHLVHNNLVKGRIAQLTEHALNEIGVTRERVLTELSRLAFVDPSDAYDNIGQLIPIREMPEDVRRSISKIRTIENFHSDGGERELVGFTKDIEFAQKKAALDSLAKYLGMSPDKIEHSGPGGKPIETVNKSELTEDQLDARISALINRGNKVE